MEKLKFVFLGTPAFSIPTLEALHQSGDVELCLVISMPDRPAGRGQQLQSPEVIQYAKKNSIAFAQSENINKDELLIQKVKACNPDVILVLAFAQFLNSSWLQMARIGVFNIHTSLLPKYRGAAPIQAAILNGDHTTGVSIQKMIKKMDAGDVVYTLGVDIPANTTALELSITLQKRAADATLDFIKTLKANKLQFTPQNEMQASYASIIKKEDGFIDFELETSQAIYRKFLAYFPWPGTYFFINNKRVKIFKMESSKKQAVLNKITLDDTITIGSQDGSIIIIEAQPEGKRALNVTEFRQWLQSQKSLLITRPT